jgi:hypothetical protein
MVRRVGQGGWNEQEPDMGGANAWVIVGAASLLTLTAGAAGQTGAAPASPSTQPQVTTGRPERATLNRMARRISLKVEKTRLEDVMRFIQESTQADMEILWTTDSQQGLDKDREITLNVANQPALYILEQVLDKAKTDFNENSWQMTPSGAIQVGPKDLLNKSKRLEIYDVQDLLFQIPNYPDVPQIDLNNVLQQSQGGGGGGQSPFTNVNNTPAQAPDREARLRAILDLLQQTIEPNQWVDNGGEGGTIRPFNGTLIINAPDYMHRQINGYAYWPATTTRRLASGKRYVGLSMDVATATPGTFATSPVPAVVPGTGGGGAPTPPPPTPTP